MRNIVLIGPMGCGKSTLGSCVAGLTSYEFIDMDIFIEDKAAMTISQMFERYGEKYFRDRESEAAEELSGRRGLIIATGGGVVLRQKNMRALSKTGIIVFLDRPLDNILSDVTTQDRPLLKDGPDRLRQIFKDRYDIYTDCANKTIKNDSTKESAAGALIELIDIQLNQNYAVIGDPIEHSKSPDIHLPVLRSYLDNPVYDKLRIRRGELEEHLDTLRALRGFNLTMPHKHDIIPYLASISREAELCGSVNTVVCNGGDMVGHTTDGAGFFSALDSAGIEYRGGHMIFLGAGGAARALIYSACINYDVKIGIAARSLMRADRLMNEIKAKVPGANIYTLPLSTDCLSQYAAEADILVNATPQGMDGVDSDWESLEFLKALPRGSAVCDLIYAPAETEFLKKARELGYKTQNGMPMLIHQAIVADSLYLDMDLNTQEMYEKVACNTKT